MSFPICPTCGGWGYVSDHDDDGNDDGLRIVPCRRGCQAPELPALEAVEAARMAERRAAEDYICRKMEAEY